jgi:hypothetical protein
MKAAFSGSYILLLTSFLVATAVSVHGDEIDMQNGDHYTGKIISLDDNTVVLDSEMLGTLRIRRDKVSTISFGAKPAAGTLPAPAAAASPQTPKVPRVGTLTSGVAAAGPNPKVNLNSSLSDEIAANSNLVNEVRSQVLTSGGPKATAKFDELVGGLAAGTINIADLRQQAESVAVQLRELRGSADNESGEIFDEYLAVLDQFLRATGTASAPAKPSNAAQPGTTKKLNSFEAPAKPTAPDPKTDE